MIGAKRWINKHDMREVGHMLGIRDNGKSHVMREAGRLLFFETTVGMSSYTYGAY